MPIIAPPIDLGPPIEPAYTWLYYQCALRKIQVDNVIRHKPLAGTVTTRTPSIDATGPWTDVASQSDVEQPSIATTVPDIIQRISSPSTEVWMTGKAIRVGYPVNPPRITQVTGGKVATQFYENVQPMELAAINGVPIYGITWDIRYLITEPISAMPLPANPAAQANGIA